MFSKFKKISQQYQPDNNELSKIGVLLNIIKRCNNQGVEIFVVGGYGIDGMHGKLTRPHDDIDLLYRARQYDGLKKILLETGFHVEDNNEEKTVFGHDRNDLSFKAEIIPIEFASKFFSGSMESVLPKEANASLSGVTFKTLTLEGQEALIAIQNNRAKTYKWPKYPKAKRRNQKTVLKLIKKEQSF